MEKNDLIPRAAAIEAAIDGADDWDGGYNPERERYIKERMAKVSAVEAVIVVHARWVRSEDGDGIVCTACGEDYCDMVVGCNPKEWKFCPVCGAIMDGERRDENA